jgi:16S rRNA (uracil1498-N3)-methyltransferase
MREPRIFTDQNLQLQQTITLEANTAHYLRTVLRCINGHRIRVFNGMAEEYSGDIIYIDQRQVQIHLTHISYVEPPPMLHLHLILSVSKADHMEVALQKATELGVNHISPLLAERSVVKFSAKSIDKHNLRWRQIIISACEQSRRCQIPKLESPQTLDSCLETTVSDCRLILHPEGINTFNTVTRPKHGVTLLIGSEGGFTSKEIYRAQNAGFVTLRLGKRILRTETAPLAALSAIQTLWGDFNQ